MGSEVERSVDTPNDLDNRTKASKSGIFPASIRDRVEDQFHQFLSQRHATPHIATSSPDQPAELSNIEFAGHRYSGPRDLPDQEFLALWDSIILDPPTEERLLSQAVLNFTLRPKVARARVPLSGAILL